MFKIYDEPLSPKEGACFKIYGERLSPTAGACLRYMKTYGPSLRRVQVPYIEAQKTDPCDSYRFFAIEGQKTIKNTQKTIKNYPKKPRPHPLPATSKEVRDCVCPWPGLSCQPKD